MDALVDRLWELANEDDDLHTARRVERITEARALWRALEVLLTSLKLQEFVVGDGAFPKLLASIRSVLSDPSYWVDKPSEEESNSVFICVNRVLLNVGRRGAHEREELVRDGVADLVVQCGEAAQNYPLTALEAIAALQTLQLLVADSLQVSHTIRMCILLMHKHETVYALQLRACQFLRQMALEEECKERVGRRGGLQALTKALARFPEETELVVTALDVLEFLCAELEYRDDSVQTDPFRSANSNDLYRVVRAVVDTMRVLQSVERVQSKGVAVLNRSVSCTM
ncbi:hypothetical protein PHMEG_0003726 [Phytophthora megakarya]|uniref:Uncharacterized protein n=1 Tax=Phytophthora megakarya TaxID=4795 RepID=A0A225WVP1_9STRA|nr:hypothetical protein PHMEG_0003726 [Phytophthora megakarya]